MRARTTGWVFVGAQVVLLAALVLVPGADHWATPAAVTGAARVAVVLGLTLAAVAAVGLGSALTPTPVPKPGARLRTTGLYRWVRHPVYSGVLLFVAGTVAGSGSYAKLGIGVATFAFFTVKARWEESRLRAAYPEYGAYADTTPRFVPFPRLRR